MLRRGRERRGRCPRKVARWTLPQKDGTVHPQRTENMQEPMRTHCVENLQPRRVVYHMLPYVVDHLSAPRVQLPRRRTASAINPLVSCGPSRRILSLYAAAEAYRERTIALSHRVSHALVTPVPPSQTG